VYKRQVAYGTEYALGPEGRQRVGMRGSDFSIASFLNSFYHVAIRLIFFFGLCYLKWYNVANILNTLFGVIVVLMVIVMSFTLVKVKSRN